ncbi:MAG: peptide-methionine (S)-S-oxide reductase MsrA [Synechococcus sp.]|nr:peptide-methionine (S)-S-oxide reductase MsrA [Synechococcus sp.]
MPFPPRLPELGLRWLLLPVLVLLLGQQPLALAATPQEAVFAGGCFWCLEHDLEGLEGVLDAESGYSGGQTANPSYRQVSAGGTGHAESVRVRFDPERISYPTLLRAFWRNVDPTDAGGQFCDRGSSYRPVIFTAGAEQEQQAQASARAAQQELGSEQPLQVAIQPLKRFWPAEGYHQDYAERNAITYRYYRWRCGRDARLDAVWGERARSAKVWFSPTAT